MVPERFPGFPVEVLNVLGAVMHLPVVFYMEYYKVGIKKRRAEWAMLVGAQVVTQKKVVAKTIAPPWKNPWTL